jgi:hypothetical protein
VSVDSRADGARTRFVLEVEIGRGPQMKASVFACLLLALSGCASQSTAVHCDTRLEPINMPAAKTLTRDNANLTPDQQSTEDEDRRE